MKFVATAFEGVLEIEFNGTSIPKVDGSDFRIEEVGGQVFLEHSLPRYSEGPLKISVRTPYTNQELSGTFGQGVSQMIDGLTSIKLGRAVNINSLHFGECRIVIKLGKNGPIAKVFLPSKVTGILIA